MSRTRTARLALALVVAAGLGASGCRSTAESGGTPSTPSNAATPAPKNPPSKTRTANPTKPDQP